MNKKTGEYSYMEVDPWILKTIATLQKDGFAWRAITGDSTSAYNPAVEPLLTKIDEVLHPMYRSELRPSGVATWDFVKNEGPNEAILVVLAEPPYDVSGDEETCSRIAAVAVRKAEGSDAVVTSSIYATSMHNFLAYPLYHLNNINTLISNGQMGSVLHQSPQGMKVPTPT